MTSKAEYGRALVEQQEGSPNERLKAMVDAILDEVPDVTASMAAESAADQLGLYHERTTFLGTPAVEVALDGQMRPPWWKTGMTMWRWGSWITISDNYRNEDSNSASPWRGYWPFVHEVIYR